MIQSKQAEVLGPLEDKLFKTHTEIAQALDHIYRNQPIKLSKSERKAIHRMLANITAEIRGRGDERADALFETYGRKEFEEEARELSEKIAFLAKEFMGVDVELEQGFFNPDSTDEELMGKFFEKMQQTAEEGKPKPPARKKTAKQLAKEQAEKEAQEQVNQSIREVYRKLASALHPDRCMDEADRERKAELMVRVNQAYEKDNILDLLTLQLEIEQIDSQHLQNISEQRLKHFNAVLKEQLAELRSEIAFLQRMLHQQVEWPLMKLASEPNQLLMAIDFQANIIKSKIKFAKSDYAALTKPTAIKSWIQMAMAEAEDSMMAMA